MPEPADNSLVHRKYQGRDERWEARYPDAGVHAVKEVAEKERVPRSVWRSEEVGQVTPLLETGLARGCGERMHAVVGGNAARGVSGRGTSGSVFGDMLALWRRDAEQGSEARGSPGYRSPVGSVESSSRPRARLLF